MMQLEVLCL